MERGIGLRRSILVATIVLTTSVAGGELLENPGFEEPVVKYDKAGWDIRGPRTISLEQVTDPVVEGKYGLLVDGRGEAQWAGIKQKLELEQGRTYRLTGSIRLGDGDKPDRGAIQLVKVFKDGAKGYQEIFRGNLTADDWVNFTELFSMSEDSVVEVVLSIHGMTGGRSFIVDNFSLTEVD